MDLHTFSFAWIFKLIMTVMTVNQGLEYLMNIKNTFDYDGAITEDTLAVGIARVGSKDVVVKAAGKISQLIDYDFWRASSLYCNSFQTSHC